MNQSLFVNRQLNYFEALRRMKYWIEQVQAGHPAAIAHVELLRSVLERDSNILYMGDK